MIKIGLFGAGHLGKIHLRLLKEIPEFEVVGFFDSNAETAAAVAAEFGAAAFSSAQELLDKIEAADIVTPTVHHYDIAARAIRQHKHTFIEKPLVTSPEESKSLMRLTREANVKVQVGYVERFNPAFITALPYIHQPLFIESHRISEYSQRGTDVPVVLDMMIHDIDIIMHLVKSPVKKVSANGVSVVSNSPDIANARIEFDNGCVANITSSRIALRKMRKTRIFQKDSYVSVDFLNKQVEVYNLAEHTGGDQSMAVLIGAPGQQKQILIERPHVPENNAIRQELQGFAKSISENIDPPVTINDGYASMEVAFRILEQLKFSTGVMVNQS